MIDSFLTVSAPAEARITRKRSRFRCLLVPVSSQVEAHAALDAVRRDKHAASHHCFASRVLEDGALCEHSDDAGEPRGSAGEPILRQLRSAQVVNVLAVVTRHYGGAKLGVGGLIRAYGDVVADALSEATITRRELRCELAVDVPTEAAGSVMAAIHRFDGRVLDSQYDRRARIVVSLVPSRVDGFTGALREATGDRARWKELT
ncbi:MAG: YigZ family protein [Candidatus Bipolaricaulota bacterium]|nr:MAG: YigZ family protein [Candidatus Bipolaricaulota bacterium]